MSNIRTRFAPSPTGFLHVGGVRTALFAWLVARQANGQFILRIEDTDRNRHVEGADRHIIECLEWLGLDYDEGPLYQSQRVQDGIYKEWAGKLIASNRAYADPYSSAEVQAFREEAQKNKQPFLYRNHRPESPPDWDGSQPLRFKSEPKSYETHDLVMGRLTTGPEVVDDFILVKSDGFPTYNFAHIVDDLEMGITHVIRGQEFMSSLPNYRNLYEALELEPPIFATVPHILNEQGNKKLSKRDGAKDILDYQKEGYLPEAMVNFLATLGWNDGTEQEIFTSAGLIKKFDPSKVQKGGAHFDERRLLWLNGNHIRSLELNSLYEKVADYWPKSAENYEHSYREKVLGLVQERLKFFAELPELTSFFFEDLPLNPELLPSNKQLKKFEKPELETLLEGTRKRLDETSFEPEALQIALNQLLEETQQTPGVLFSLIRIATTQAPASPGLAETLALLGKETVLRRIDQQLSRL